MLNKIKDLYTKITVKHAYKGIEDFSVPVNAWAYDELSVASSGDPFREVTEIDYSPLVRRFQAGSSSCVAQTCALMNSIEIGGGYVASATPMYAARSNKPGLGMSYVDVVKLLPTQRIQNESSVLSQYLSESEMNNPRVITGEDSRNPVLEPLSLTKSFYEVARAVNQNGKASIWFRCKVDNWLRWVIDKCEDSNEVSHSVAIIDAIKKDGVNYLVALDSAGTYFTSSVQPDWIKTYGVRLITEKAFNEGVYNQWTAVDIKKEPPQGKPQHTFTYSLKYGMLNNNDVRKLQEILIYEGLLDSRAKTGNYKNMTRSAVKAFQLKHKVASVQEITQLAGMSVGNKTRAKLNELYA